MSEDYNQEINNIKIEVSKLWSEINHIKLNKVDTVDMQSDLGAVESELIKLHSKLEEVVNDRKEDKELTANLVRDMNRIKDIIQQTEITNTEIKVNQAHTLENVKDIKTNMGEMKSEMREIKELITFNWLEKIKGFINDNIITKIFSWTFILSLMGAIVSAFIYYIKNLF